MRLAQLLSALTPDEIKVVADAHVRKDETLSHVQLCIHLENSIRSSRFLADFIINCQPPTFSILTALLESPGFELDAETLRATADASTEKIRNQLDAKEILERDDTLSLYRKLFHTARRSNHDINPSESPLLGVYRVEQNISLVAHFLLEYHTDFRSFWVRENAFELELESLRRAGIVFTREGKTVLPEDLVVGVMQALGLDMTSDATRRLLNHVASADMEHVLEKHEIKSSGSRAEREERILRERIQAREILPEVGIQDLRDICRKLEISMQGNKEEVIERLISHFASGRDLIVEAPPPPPEKQERSLDEGRFRLLFQLLKNQELIDILRAHEELKQTGSKEQRVATLWESHLNEASLLGELTNRDLEDVLDRAGLRISGSKPERIDRLIAHFAGQSASAPPGAGPAIAEASTPSPEVAQMQEAFRQHSSAGVAALETWLNEVLDGGGLIKCYATEVPNPSQQLKNKLSQAISAKNGILVLALADADALAKAEEALAERWETNDEWPKVVASVALSQPLAGGQVEVIVERVKTDLNSRLRSRIFPSARHVRITTPSCASCGTELPTAARFCSNCGTPAAANVAKPQDSSANVGPQE